MRAGAVSFATVIIASARFKPASGRSRCAAPGCATAGVQERPARSVSPRRSCRPASGGPSRSRNSCPWLYLKGISTGDFTEALAALLGPDAPGLSASTITRLKDVWQGELARWEKRDLSARRYLYFWADGIYFQPRMEHDKQCILVIIGADQWGRKELLAIADGYRESAQSWRELLLDLKRRGLEVAPELAVGDGALGFWKALRESHGTTREQRCWLHKTGNVLNKLPKSLQAKAKGHLQDIWLAETKDRAEKAFDFFLEAYGAKYDKATACLAKDRAGLLTFYDFPAEHWKHLRTTNPIDRVSTSLS